MILEEEDYTIDKKKTKRLIDPFAGIYWMLTLGIYLFYSFVYKAWDRSWIIWFLAGMMFGILYMIGEIIIRRKK